MEVPTLITGEKPVITVLLSNKNSHVRKGFHCAVCGRIVFEYYSDVRVILPGEYEKSASPLVVQCSGAINVNGLNTRCKTRYYIA